jgi:hypothetical protein
MARAPARPRRPAPVAAAATLRRVARVAAAWAALGASLYLAQGAWRGALTLTLAAAASIVGFRGLEGLVRRLRPDAQGGIGEGAGVGFHVRFLVLLAALILALILGGRDHLALILGLTALPLAVITEALIQLVSLGTRRESGDGSTG